MFPRRFFPGRYFAPRYWPQSDGGEPVDVIPDYEVCLHGRDFRTVTLTGANGRTVTLSGRNHRTVTLPGSQSGPC